MELINEYRMQGTITKPVELVNTESKWKTYKFGLTWEGMDGKYPCKTFLFIHCFSKLGEQVRDMKLQVGDRVDVRGVFRHDKSVDKKTGADMWWFKIKAESVERLEVDIPQTEGLPF